MALTESEELELLELEEEEYQVSQSPQTSSQPESSIDYGQVAGQAFGTAITGPFSATQAMAKNPEKLTPYASTAGALVGSAFGPMGTAIGAGTGQMVGRMGDIAFGTSAPVQPTTSLFGFPAAPREAIVPATQTAIAGLPEVGGVKQAVQNLAQRQGARALGFTKRMMKRGGEEQAKQTAQTMLDKGVIRFGSGAKATLERAEDVAETAGQSMSRAGSQFAKEGLRPLDTNVIGVKISEQLTPKFSGGVYDAEKRVVDEILDTVGAHGNGPIDFSSAQALKEKLQEMGKFLSNTDATKANLYRRASGIVREAIDESVKASGSSTAPAYLRGKQLYGSSSRAIEGLTDKVSAQLANNPVGPYGVIAGAARLAGGDVPGGLAALGAVEGIKRVGAASTAAMLNSTGMGSWRRAILSQLVDRFIDNRRGQ